MTLSHDGRLELTIAKASKRDAGTYSCVATNHVGRAESFASVKVTQKSQETDGEAVLDDQVAKVEEKIKKDIP